MKNLIITFTGPSCGGKTTLMEEVIRRFPDQFCRLRSFTSRPRREGEGDKEYDFITQEDAEQLILDKKVIQFVDFKGLLYGTSCDQLEEVFQAGKIGITVVEPTGVTQFRKAATDHGFNHMAFYLEADPATVGKRWAERMMVENVPPEKYDMYRQRIGDTFDVELPHWPSAETYDFSLPSYERSNWNTLPGVVLDIINSFSEKGGFNKSA